HRHHGNRAHDAGGFPALLVARRSKPGRFARGAALLQAAGAAHMVRRCGDGDGWCAVALGSASAGRGAQTGAEQGRTVASGVGSLRHLLIAALLTLFVVPTAIAVEPDEIISDPALEARARALSKELRCMVCQNQSIDDSNAPLAHDLRVLVRERLQAGESDQQVIDFLVARYGEFVLLRPRF